MILKPGAFWSLAGINSAVGVIGFLAALGWAKSTSGATDRDTVIFLAKMFGGISLAFLIIIILAR